LVPPTDLFKRTEQFLDQVARRAFEIFESNGRKLGHDLEDWFKAESELFRPTQVKIAETASDVTVRAEVPGFTAEDLEVALEPRRLTITGKHQTKQEKKEEKTVYTETTSEQLFRVVNLPTAVDVDKAETTLQKGILELKAPKASPPKKLQIAGKGTKLDEQC
jgi:HSP20 family protein